jgi:EpsI family protein
MTKRVLIVAVCLLLTMGARAWVSRTPAPPTREMLSQFPTTLEGWSRVFDDTITPDVAAVLRADDVISRRYQDGQGHFADLFIAYYQTQKAGESMHSPKNCLPGAGWRPVLNDTVMINGGSKGQIEVNRYVVEKANARGLVLYWYQAGGRVIASEYSGKAYLVLDALRTGRRDGGIVRVFVPMRANDTPDNYMPTAVQFAELAARDVARFLPD